MSAEMSLIDLVSRAGQARKERSMKKLQVIYEPSGRAREYAARAANLYSGCDHGCKYCYAPLAVHKTRENFGSVSERPGILRKLEADCALLSGADIEPVLLSFTCDPYSQFDWAHGLTRNALQIFRKHGVPFQVLTKGGTRAARDFDLYGPNDVFASTLTFIDPAKSREWEPGAALPGDRFEAIRKAHDMGIRTWVSLEPVISPAESLQIIDLMEPYVDLFKVGTLNHHALGKTIDWRAFGSKAVRKLQKYNKNYYIKDDLRAYL
jgi:DNA repair photolyase